MITDLELGWLSGIIDGEGCIMAAWSNRKREVGGSLCVKVQIEACSDVMILRCAQLLQGLEVHFYLSPLKLKKGGNRPSRQLLVKRRADVLKLLRILHPHLVVKQKEAELGIWFYSRWGDQRGRNTALAPKDEKIFVWTEMRKLKGLAYNSVGERCDANTEPTLICKA
jgi:hypothetical protein